MNHSRQNSGFTLIEIIVLLVIITFVLGIAIPKFISATNLRKAKEVTILLNRLFEAQYSYHHKHGTFTPDISALPINDSSLKSKWFYYSIPYARKDTFFILASVRRAFGKATTSDWVGISSDKSRTISNPKTLGKYAIEWMSLIIKDEKKMV
jgi:type II secretory pathway pseudopilin PulG